LTIDSTVSPTQYQFMLTDPNSAEFAEWVPKLTARLQQSPELADVATDLQQNGQSVYVEIDRPTAARFGITPATVDNALYDAFGQRIISTIFTQSNQYRVILESQPTDAHYSETLNGIYLPSSTATSGQVPLSAIATFHERAAPLLVTHLGQFPATTVSFNLAPGASLGAAVTAIDQAKQDIGLPASFQIRFQGAALAFQASLSNELFLILAAIVTMYIVLGVLYESFIHPITILSGLPSAAFGALLTLQIFHLSLDLYGFVGVIMLIGIVKKNAIMMVDFAVERERSGHKTAAEAIYEGCLIRFRPITMTTMAALMGTAPIAFGIGAGADARRPLGLAVVGGLIFSQMVTLYLTRVFYTDMDTFQGWLEDRFGKMTGKRNADLADGHVSAD
jgi:multidrug efflux pump